MHNLQYLRNAEGNPQLLYKGMPEDYVIQNTSKTDTLCVECATFTINNQINARAPLVVFTGDGEIKTEIATFTSTEDLLTFFPIDSKFRTKYATRSTDFKHPILLPPEHYLGLTIHGEIGNGRIKILIQCSLLKYGEEQTQPYLL